MLQWNVYVNDINRRTIRTYNIFDHWKFLEDCQHNAKKHKDDKEAFAQELLRDIKYYFWSKCEWEIIITSWPPPRDPKTFDDIKVDVYNQIALNWDIFLNYVWEHRKELKSANNN